MTTVCSLSVVQYGGLYGIFFSREAHGVVIREENQDHYDCWTKLQSLYNFLNVNINVNV